jgi:hypothetical protein
MVSLATSRASPDFDRIGRPVPNGWVARMLRSPSEVGSSTDRRSSGAELKWALHARGWWRVPSLLPAVAELEHVGRERAVTPRAFKRVLLAAHSQLKSRDTAALERLVGKAYVDGLQNVTMFLTSRALGWQTISDFGAFELIAKYRRSGTGPYDYFVSLGQLMVLAREINLILGWSRPATRPRYCELCWRVSMTSKRCCPVHSATTTADHPADSRSVELQPVLAHDSYWYAHRPAFRLAFQAELERLTKEDRRRRSRTAWREAVKSRRQWLWIANHRPEVFVLASDLLDLDSGAVSLADLVQRLDFVSQERAAERRLRLEFHALMTQDPVAVFDQLLRAEAWLRVANERSSNWGGARVNAGRPAIKRPQH